MRYLVGNVICFKISKTYRQCINYTLTIHSCFEKNTILDPFSVY